MTDFERVLVVGDPHLKLSRLEDSRLFLEKLAAEAFTGRYKTLIILGDLFDNYAIIRSEIMTLWSSFITRASKHFGDERVVLMVGNHDYSSAKGGSHALEPFKTVAHVIDEHAAWKIAGVTVNFLPFIRSQSEFEELCRNMEDGSVLFCHQSFNGVMFDNGFYDPNGADPKCVAHLSRVISGHIHTAQSVGENIYYPGTPYQQSFADAGQRKGLYYVTIGESRQQKCQSEKHIELDMPEFVQVEYPTIDALRANMPKPDATTSYKLVAEGTPQEILELTRGAEYKHLTENARRVVPAFKAKKDAVAPRADNVPREARLRDFIMSRNWRTEKEVLLGRAEALIAN
jgi:DNA repair exonuclease SbcCD nuclease subunit